MIRLCTFILFASLAVAAEPETVLSDSMFADTSLTIQAADTTSPESQSLASGWLLPLSIIGATAGVFIILFTARSK